MGIYVVTGGTKGIGEQTVNILLNQGHEVINIDIDGGDINADLGTREGREFALSEMWRRCPDGLDGLVCNHGIAGRLDKYKASYVLSVNYFGALAIIEGLYDLLKMKRGNCAVTSSGSIAPTKRGKYYVDQLLNNCGDEERIGRLVDTYDMMDAGHIVYVSTKIAIARFVRRAAPSFSAKGVNINAVAPGSVDTTILHGLGKPDERYFYYPIPAYYGQDKDLMDPYDVAQALAFFASPAANGVSGMVMLCDTGSASILDTDRYY